MKIEDAKPDLPVTYLPPHAQGNLGHSEAEHGVVVRKNSTYIFVAFRGKPTPKACLPETLHKQ